MIKSLVISNSRCFIEKLINEDINISINGITNNEDTACQILNKKNLDIIFLDKAISDNFSNDFFKIYKEELIVLSDTDLSNINQIVNSFCFNYSLKDRRDIIIRELKYLGYNFKYSGSQYLTDAILYGYLNKEAGLDNLQGYLYPIIAKSYDKSIQNVKNSIMKATEHMYYDCDVNRLKTYFSLPEDIRPSIKEIISTFLRKIG